jgi:hypothetical protein
MKHLQCTAAGFFENGGGAASYYRLYKLKMLKSDVCIYKRGMRFV